MAFTTGYLATWAAAGVVAFLIGLAGRMLRTAPSGGNNAGQAIAGVTLLVAAGYELTPLKDVCLGKCRSPLGTLLGSWRAGWAGAFRMGLGNGAWCVGCCWALMASLFALGVMSVTWMAASPGSSRSRRPSRGVEWRRTERRLILVVLGVSCWSPPTRFPVSPSRARARCPRCHRWGPEGTQRRRGSDLGAGPAQAQLPRSRWGRPDVSRQKPRHVLITQNASPSGPLTRNGHSRFAAIWDGRFAERRLF